MNWHWTSLRDVLRINPAPITLLESVFYKQASVPPYPHGVILKAAKSGFDFPHKQQKTIVAGQFVISRVCVQRKLWGIVPSELDGAIVAQSYVVFDLQPHLHPDYFAAYLATPLFSRAALAARSKRGRLSVQQFGHIRFPLPPLEDQYRVAELWKYASSALRHTAEMFSSIADTKSGVANELFRNVNSSWEQKRLGECADIGRDKFGSNVLSVRLSNEIVLGTTIFDEARICIAPSMELDSLFLYYYLESQKQVWRSALNSTKSNLEGVLRAFPLLLPTLYEQRKIAAVIEQHDEALSCLRTEQAALRHLIQGIMHLIFNGTLNLQEAVPMLQNALRPTH